MRERFASPLGGANENGAHYYFVIGTLECPVMFFETAEEKQVDTIVEAYRRAVIEHGCKPLDLIWSADKRRPGPLYALATNCPNTPPVMGFEVEIE
ncbi:hypothetical protein CCAX7_36210 [Capsulimonas corticalis]|uniref:Uncharacterized protein n=1 Tax=Capsulimonas corticalis TaxID=2219043 RepID=A0A402D6X1_9BACT|nr:hypothetical protein CCAX7_36210 [Capsulimonas corticalis]